MQHCKGLPASGGIAIGKAWVYRPQQIKGTRHPVKDSEQEWQRLQHAFTCARTQLQELAARAQTAAGKEEAAIFAAHQLFLEDAELLSAVQHLIQDEHLNAEAAVADSFEHYAEMLLALEDTYFQARAQDVRDVKQRVLRILSGKEDDAPLLSTAAIVIAEDLTPSDTIQFDRCNIIGICTVRGGPTSHTVILARALGVPAVVSAPLDLSKIAEGAMVVLDGDSGEVVVGATPETIAQARQRAESWQQQRAVELAVSHQPALTRDGHQVKVVANVGSLEDAQQALAMGAEGIGLLRTEFLYLNRRQLPAENEQVEIYRRIFEVMAGRPVVVRTLDIGGDKPAPYLHIQTESNPFLGWRAIRMMSERPDILINQLSALLIAATKTTTDLRIMLPLVSCLGEVEQAKTLFDQAASMLREQGYRLPEVQFGIMIEVPSAALLASHFAHQVDFFSIGTNDLTQYTLAVDRTNERVASLASPYHPAVLKLIAETIRAAHALGKWVGMCGEFAGDPMAAPLLLGLGLDEFSMAPASIPTVKQAIRRWRWDECQQIAQIALGFATAAAVRTYLQGVVRSS